MSNVSWTTVFSSPNMGYINKSNKEWKEALKTSNHQIIWRQCFECQPEHRNIYYRRLTSWGRINIKTLFLGTWKDKQNGTSNILNKDFELYSSYRDAVRRVNKWNHCNYGVRNLGFPRDCGKDRLVVNPVAGGSKGGSKRGRRNKGSSKKGREPIAIESRSWNKKNKSKGRWRFYIEKKIDCVAHYDSDYISNNQPGNPKNIPKDSVPGRPGRVCSLEKPICKKCWRKN